MNLPTVDAPTKLRAVGLTRLVVRLVLAATILALLAVEAGVIAPNVGRAAHSLTDTDLRWLLFAVLAELWSMVAFARLQRRMLSGGRTDVAGRHEAPSVGRRCGGGRAVRRYVLPAARDRHRHVERLGSQDGLRRVERSGTGIPGLTARERTGRLRRPREGVASRRVDMLSPASASHRR